MSIRRRAIARRLERGNAKASAQRLADQNRREPSRMLRYLVWRSLRGLQHT